MENNELLQSLGGNANYRHVQFLDAFLQQDYFRFAEFALQNNMTTSDFCAQKRQHRCLPKRGIGENPKRRRL